MRCESCVELDGEVGGIYNKVLSHDRRPTIEDCKQTKEAVYIEGVPEISRKIMKLKQRFKNHLILNSGGYCFYDQFNRRGQRL